MTPGEEGLRLIRRYGAAERRAAVLLRPERFTTNPPGTEHQERP
ncbi:hypothetical protein ABZW49_05990 [Nonomuraea wenchangensis]